MRIVYLASTPDGYGGLQLEHEITEMQQRFAAATTEPFRFDPLPAVKVEDVPGELTRHSPDVLHVAAHGSEKGISLAKDGGSVLVTAEMLASFLPPGKPPKLIYLNSCNSDQLAADLVKQHGVAFAIGTSAPITNAAARAAAKVFYERMACGATLQAAFDVSKAMLEGVSGSNTRASLHHRRDVNPASEVLYPVPALIADFVHPKARPRGDEHYELRIGVRGCPSTTTQVIFFTDDESFIDDEDDLESDLSHVVRTSPVRGFVWTPSDSAWAATGDFRIAATGVMAGGGCFAVEGALCEALERRYVEHNGGRLPEYVKRAIETLRRSDGAELEPAVWDEKVKTRARQNRRLPHSSPRRRRSR